MVLKIDSNDATDLINIIKKLDGIEEKAGVINLPETLGSGYMKLIRPVPELSLILQQYELNEEVTIKRKGHSEERNILTFSFRNVLRHQTNERGEFPPKVASASLPSVQVSTPDVVLDIKVPAHFKTSNLIIGVQIDFLKQLLQYSDDEKLLEIMTKAKQSYLFEEIISTKIQSVAAEIFQTELPGALANYFYRIKAEELIYLFLSDLLKRQEITYYPVHQNDIKKIFAVRDEVVKNLNTPPQLQPLAQGANMSLSKLGRLFRQIFGESIYHYYQKLRMQEAAFLLCKEGLSVSEVGYQLGFSNLSHFTRLFEKHMGIKPKKYSRMEK